MAKTTELRALPEPELRSQLHEARKTLQGFRLKAMAGSLEQPHQLRQSRRQVARLLTLLKEQTKTQQVVG